MPPLNWDVFVGLPGSRETNFEILCRAAVRRHYAQYGIFAARAAQPGVEFHLKLERSCSLGDAGRWYGWQCRWYDLPSGRPISTTRRNKIIEALETSHRELPQLSDWVLWTRFPLTAGDQAWFRSLSTHMTLHLWTTAELEEHLAGEAEILRGTYFGDLVLTPQLLAERHRESVEPIRKRWVPEVHRSVRAERDVRAMLGETGSWQDLADTASQLRSTVASLSSSTVPEDVASLVQQLTELAELLAGTLEIIRAAIIDGDLDHLRHKLSELPPQLDTPLRAVPRRLRAANLFSGLLATNLVARMRHSHRLFARVEQAFKVSLVAIVADAGYGKTQLSAQLTAPAEDRPCGVLLYGRDLHAGHTLDDLARRVVIVGAPAKSMESLLAALDAAGQRAGRRLPLVIDGLNEAEDPRDWKPLLASIGPLAAKYPYVLIVCTIRGAFAEEALPDDIVELEIRDFGEDFIPAIHGYFTFYKIDPTDADVPFEMLAHPLKLRLYCEVTNPTRAKIVSIESAPGSLTGLLDQYLHQAIARIVELAPRSHRYYQHDVRTALDDIGATLWEKRARSLPLLDLRTLLRDEHRPWDQSLVRAFEQEGVLIRIPRDDGSADMAPVFDALGGHLVADAVVTRQGQAAIEPWLSDAMTQARLSGDYDTLHPLASDIFTSLVGLFPRRLHRRQFWEFLSGASRSAALRLAADLEASYVDAATVEQLVSLVKSVPSALPDVFERLRQTRNTPAHPLNSEFLDRVLRGWTVADRDLRWSEWLRRRYSVSDVQRLLMRWREGRHRSTDVHWARWLMWTLTSTVRDRRDEATRALYWFGRLAPNDLFDLTLSSFGINDAYVSERMLAASYGVAMAHQRATPSFTPAFARYLRDLAAAVLGADATHPTNHWLAREYIRGTFELAAMRNPTALPPSVARPILFAPAPEIEPLSEDDERTDEIGYTQHTDFSNYTVGSLFEDRANYDMEHQEYLAAMAYVRGVVWDLGWREASFGRVEEEIASSTWTTRIDRPPAERYGKKYGWIGFYAYAGILENKRQRPIARSTLAEVELDPSFPEVSAVDGDIQLQWLSPDAPSDEQWIGTTPATSVPDELFQRARIRDHEGPWIAVHASLRATDKILGRKASGMLAAFAIDPAATERFISIMQDVKRPSWQLTDIPEDHYTFAGEIPWAQIFAVATEDDGPFYKLEVKLGAEVTELEIFAHRYGWESQHSSTNQAGGAPIPSRSFSIHHATYGLPQSFDQALSDESKASITLRAPEGTSGHILFLRADLLRSYLAGRSLVWVAWGERNLYGVSHSPPTWYSEQVREGKNLWRIVRDAGELMPAGNSPRGTASQRKRERPPRRTRSR